ncbi:sn-glycerol-3-phosphate ABC transporter ATP-binding protein UgpC [Devosia algicola]|uniref:Sn-glycerol-3-phosphate ABC transporter ATP-binding protein UgpC n=1 Tax=Devosia algicola TaxID=3026418 RepID=A0ABY7YST7_9HYPH|nr:sn-glycerol-3-phosphate ABC transporter ATP-binding protein UgpC [Devosia algicola]WDR03915.1 sn-glycerol-3-phosphate ABC transporter ATP-binding protein UgpC [Devosia algicola]
MASVELKAVTKSFGSVKVIEGIDLAIEKGEFVAFVGPSGSGKSTLLRMIAGLETVTEGDILIDGKDVTFAEPSDRGIAMVFQSYALYPHMNVYDNIAFNLKLSKFDRTEIDTRVKEAARILRLEELLSRSPAQLSGGQRQRVAIGRAIVRHPKVFLFDEPLSNLDAALRVQMRLEIERLHRELGATMIYVTHDQVEAMTLADRIVALDEGVIQQVGPPLDLYAGPSNKFVAGFIGSPKMNMLPGTVLTVANGVASIGLDANKEARLDLPLKGANKGDAVTIGVRPEGLELIAAEEAVPDGITALPARVESVERLGNITFVYLDAGAPDVVTIQLIGHSPLTSGKQVRVGLRADHVHIFNAGGSAITTAKNT